MMLAQPVQHRSDTHHSCWFAAGNAGTLPYACGFALSRPQILLIRCTANQFFPPCLPNPRSKTIASRASLSSSARASRLNPHSRRHCRRTTRRRDFVPWRFSAAGRLSAWLDCDCRRPKTCT